MSSRTPDDGDSSSPIIERSLDGKRGFRDGWKQGFDWALAGVERGLTLAELRAASDNLTATMDATIEREDMSSRTPDGDSRSLEIAAGMLQRENAKLRRALASCLRDRREADKVYIHATDALGPNEASNALAAEEVPCEQCGDRPGETAEWGPWLCDGCSEMTARGDGGEGDINA